MFVSGQLTFETLFFTKYCRSLFPLDNSSLVAVSLSACAEPHVYLKEDIIQKLGPIFACDTNAAKQFLEK